jgi:CheY-like chemotaxis protein
MRTVLVVDDEFGVAEVLDAILTDEGFYVTTAANGRQALARIAERRPDLVLLDYMMPVLDGAGVLRALAADRSADGLPVVVMSALPEEAIAAVTRRYKAFLRKPFRIRSILAAIEQAMPACGVPCGEPKGAG